MKKLLASLLLACIALPACNTDKTLAEKVLQSVKNGELHFAQTPSGRGLIIIPNEIPNTFAMAHHLVAENEGKGNMLDYRNNLHNIPKGLESYEFVKEWSDSTDICQITDISPEVYEKDTLMRYKEQYKTYEDFKKSSVNTYKNSTKFEFLDNKSKIKHCKKVFEKRFYYKCKTAYGNKRVQVCFLKESDKLELFAIFSEDI